MFTLWDPINPQSHRGKNIFLKFISSPDETNTWEVNVWAGATQLRLIVFIGQYGGRTSLQDMAHNGKIRGGAMPQPAYTHARRGQMRQDRIRTRWYLGFPQTGMKEDFAITRPLQRGWRHCTYVIRDKRKRKKEKEKKEGVVVNPLPRL